jgi:hypothetical protein
MSTTAEPQQQQFTNINMNDNKRRDASHSSGANKTRDANNVENTRNRRNVNNSRTLATTDTPTPA